MPKIMLLITQMERAGAQRSMMQIARGLSQRGWDVCVVTFYDKGEYCSYFENSYSLPIVNLEAWSKIKPFLIKLFYFIRGMFRLVKLLYIFRPDVIQCFTHYSNILGLPLAWICGVPVRVSRQAISTDKFSQWLQTLDCCIANSFLTSKMVAVSERTRQDSVNRQGIHSNKIVTIPNALELDAVPDQDYDIRHELGLPPSAIIALVVARLHRLKGHIYLGHM